MTGNAWVGARTLPWLALTLGVLGCIPLRAASAADCPSHTDALGTSRTLVVDPKEHPRIGTMQYAETLPLGDHEVVLTFDDGPLPRNSNKVLEILASQCVKATFFIVGRMAKAYPEGVRKLAEAGHTIGTHSEDHPLSMNRMPIERAKQEVDGGIELTAAALGNPAKVAPFFRVPGLARADGVEEYVASKGLQIWSADFPADDWRHVSPSRVYELAMKRLDNKGKGILLLHDIQSRTVAALPKILHELKARGYRIVHVVPATPQNPATPTEAWEWQLHPPSESVAISHWPKIPNFVFGNAVALPAPSLSDMDWRDGQTTTVTGSARTKPGRGIPQPREPPWPRQSQLKPYSEAIALPVPAQDIFEVREGLRVAMHAVMPSSRRTERLGPNPAEADSAEAADSRRVRGKPHHEHARQAAGRTTHQAAHARRGTLKQSVLSRKRSV